jgi:hypothetical protein
MKQIKKKLMKKEDKDGIKRQEQLNKKDEIK